MLQILLQFVICLVSYTPMEVHVVICLQRHLSPEEFETLFKMTRSEFYRLPEFKRNDEKMRVGLWSSEEKEKGGRSSVAGMVY